MVHLFTRFIELGPLVYGLFTIWYDTDGCAKQYRCNLDIYLMTVLSSLYGITMDHIINVPVY